MYFESVIQEITTREKNILPMIVVYKMPLDASYAYIARLFRNDKPTLHNIKAHSYEAVLEVIPKGMARVNRDETDESQIVETWI